MYLLLQSIIVYSLFACLLFANSNAVSVNQIRLASQSNKWYSLPKGYWICIVIFVVISGLRYKVGVDYYSYLQDYLSVMNGTFEERQRGIEYGYLFCTQLFGSLQIHPTIYFAFLAFLQIFFVIKSVKNERDVMPYMMIVIILGPFYLSWMNGIRQMIVACSFVWATQFIVTKDIKKYLLWLCVAYLWHKSSVILIIPYLFAYYTNIWDKKWLNIFLLCVCLYLGNTPTWINITENLGGFLNFIGYHSYSEMMQEITNSASFQRFSIGPRMVLMLISYFMVILYYPKVRQFYKHTPIDLFFKLFFIGVCGYYLFVNTNLLFLRPVQYFDIFALPMIAYTLAYLKRSSEVSFRLMILASLSFVYIQSYDDFILPVTMRHATLFQFYPFFD